MPLLTDPDAALRLAKALAADVRLYQEAAIRERALPPEVLAEARELFEARVDASLHPVFESVFAELRAACGPATQGTARPRSTAPSTELTPSGSPGDDLRRILLGAGLFVLLLVATAAAMAYLVRR